MIVPIGHEDGWVRHWPWVSLAIIAACLLAHLVTAQDEETEARSQQAFEAAAEYYVARPYLELDPRLLPAEVRDLWDPEVLDAASRVEPVSLQQRRLDALTATWLASLEDDAHWRHGLVPAELRWSALLTHLFLHGDWWHLLGNLLFFYLTAPFVEDRLGRAVLALLFLGGGVAAGGSWALLHADMFRPLIGSSGAVAACMGAFLVLFARTRIRFVFWGGIFAGTFRAPAWLMLPLWVLGEALMAFVAASDPLGTTFGGVAYAVHVTGFVFGVVIAGPLAVRARSRHRLEESTAPTIGELADPVVTAALRAQAVGRQSDAWRILIEAARTPGAGRTALEMTWDLGLELRRFGDLAPVATRLIRDDLDHGYVETALHRWHELRRAAPEIPPDPATTAHLATAVLADRGAREAEPLIRSLVERFDSATPVGVVTKGLHLAQSLGGELRDRAIQKALDHPDLPDELRRELEGRSLLG